MQLEMEHARDKMTVLGRSVIQHGPLSDRVYLMKLHPDDVSSIVSRLEELTATHGYSKIFAKVPDWAAMEFEDAGFRTEAEVPGFYNGRTGVRFMARYLAPWRRKPGKSRRVVEVLRTARKKGDRTPPGACAAWPDGFVLAELGPSECEGMAELYEKVFASYPFPIFDPEYLRETMEDGVRYTGAFRDGTLAGLSSAEVDREGGNAEMTDFAILPEFRGDGLAGAMLGGMERTLGRIGIPTAYTIARAVSYGMNITFARAGYRYAGTLINNTHIAGGLESMNVWHKRVLG
ncbi:MAG TPA: putative beta-lysine N-acetyltransferase [Desulfomicrobiaceae bacterium]|nr:putative beta-lysine N-acetyltransferase [Desulfomicrobiaceae bacterium]